MEREQFQQIVAQTTAAVFTWADRLGISRPSSADMDDAIGEALLCWASADGVPAFAAIDYLREESRKRDLLRKTASAIGRNRIQFATDYRVRVSDLGLDTQTEKTVQAYIADSHPKRAAKHLTPRQIALMTGEIEFTPTDRFEKKSN